MTAGSTGSIPNLMVTIKTSKHTIFQRSYFFYSNWFPAEFSVRYCILLIPTPQCQQEKNLPTPLWKQLHLIFHFSFLLWAFVRELSIITISFLSLVSSYVIQREYFKIHALPIMKTANNVTTRCKSAHPGLHFALWCMVCFPQTVA